MNFNPSRLTRNNFDLVRFVLSLMVCLVHSSQLSAARELAFIPELLSSSMAVQSFFVVSGFLVFMSFERSSSLASFAQKRVRRLYPGYIFVVLGFAIGLFFISTQPTKYFSRDWVGYLVANAVFLNFLHPTLPGVFEGNAVHAVNGALWSLKIEVSFYLSVPVIAYLLRFNRFATLCGVYMLSILWSWWMLQLARQGGAKFEELARQLPGALAFFVSGAAVYFYRDIFERHITWLLTAAVMLLILDQFVQMTFLYPAALAIVVCFCALFCFLGNFGRFGDFSYGLYILHFPILQILVGKGLFAENVWLGLSTEIALSLVASVALWNFVEKKFLFRSSHYVVAASADSAPASSIVGIDRS